MNINIHIGINQGTININSVEFTGNASKSAENTSNKGYEKNTVVWERAEERDEGKRGDITPAYTPAYGVKQDEVETQKGSIEQIDISVSSDSDLDVTASPFLGMVAEENVVVEKQRKNENVSRKGKNVDENRENVDKSEKGVNADPKEDVVHQREAEEIAQQILEEIKEVYTPKKKDGVFLSNIYLKLYDEYERRENIFYYFNKSERVRHCGSFLAYEISERGEKKLIKASTCHVRLCPMCMWRRALKAYREMCIIYNYVQQEVQDSKFLLLTLTQKNVSAGELGKELDKILYGFNRLTKRKEIKKFCLGFVRSLELTYNKKADTYHPHVHMLIHTTEKLYSGRNYLSKKDYIKIWHDIMNLEYDPNIDIRKFKPKDKNKVGKELAEICKYSVKPSDYIYTDNENLTKKVTKVLDEDLRGRRLLSYGGTIRKARKKLLFSDDIGENDDIIVMEDVQANQQGYIELYKWHFGEEQYKRLSGEEREYMLKFVVRREDKNE